MENVLKKIEAAGVVPVIAIDSADKAVPLAKALIAGGIPCAEITFRTAAGPEAIRRIAQEVPEVLVGAGTVLTSRQADEAVAAGARFVVSPGFNPRVVDHCLANGVHIVPGCATPSDMEQAVERGLAAVKFFPAEPAGGIAYLRAVAAPYPMLRFMPTGGIAPDNLAQYLAFPKVFACGGSWMVQRELVAQGCYERISELCKQAVAITRAARGR